jgi:hypothetical protein
LEKEKLLHRVDDVILSWISPVKSTGCAKGLQAVQNEKL